MPRELRRSTRLKTRSQANGAAKRTATESNQRAKRARPNPSTNLRRSSRLAQSDAPVQKKDRKRKERVEDGKRKRQSSRLKAKREMEVEKEMKEEEPPELIQSEYTHQLQHFSMIRELGFSKRWRSCGEDILNSRTESVLKSDYSVKRIRTLASGDKIWTMEVHPTHNLAFTGAKSGNLGIWNFEKEIDETNISHVHSNRITDIIVRPGVKNCYTVSLDGWVKLYDIERGLALNIMSHEVPLHCGELCTLNNTMYCGDTNGTCVYTDPRLPRTHFFGNSVKLCEKNKKVASIACHGFNLWAATNDARVSLYDVRKLHGGLAQPIDVFTAGKVQNSVRVSHDGTKLAVAGRDDFIRVFSNPAQDLQSVQKVKHSNKTGIWISPFRPTFHPTNPNFVFSGELETRSIGIYKFSASQRKISKIALKDKKVGSVFSFGQFHAPTQSIVSVSYGKVHLWTNS